jgi:tetratricopeptide (TPR) repeat protein
LRLVLANAKLKAKDYAGTMAALQPVLQTDPNNTDALLLTAEALNGTGRTAEAVTSLQKAVSVYRASNRPVPQDVYRRLVAFAYLQKMPIAGQLATDWVQAYPSATNWRDAIRIYSSGSGLSENDMIDLFRLQRAAGALAGESDYFRYASTASSRGLPGEAKAVLDEGFASKAIDRARPMFRDTYTLASGRIAADRASLAAAEKAALAGAAAKGAMSTGDAYLGYGDYAKAAAMYRAALTKSGADTSLANLRLGIALGRSGDKAGATAALNAVTGPRAGIAKLWLAWLATRS